MTGSRRPDRAAHPLLVADSGQVTAFVVVLTAALILLLGLVVDGGQALAARLRAVNAAQEAARAAAQAIDLAGYRRTGRLRLDPARATAAARGWLAGTGDTLTGIAVSADRVTITVHHTGHTQILRIAGLTTIDSTGTATAQAEGGTPAQGRP